MLLIATMEHLVTWPDHTAPKHAKCALEKEEQSIITVFGVKCNNIF